MLIRKGYPDKRTLELVADRYHLDRTGRTVLFRGVYRDEVNKRRRAGIMSDPPSEGSLLKVDALNQLYTVASYLMGRLVFVSSDGLLRDASGFLGEPLPRKIMQQAVQQMHSELADLPDLQVQFFLDTQADSFESLREELINFFPDGKGSFKLIDSERVDALLVAGNDFVLATSDSVIIDRTSCPVLDLARRVLVRGFSANFPEISVLLSEID